MKKFDIHTHILPSIDDGASDIDISILLLEALEEQGVTHIAFTPHFYTQYEDIENRLAEFLEAREKAYKLVKENYTGSLTFTVGAEVHLSENILLIENLKDLCYRSTNYLLIEMPYNSSFSDEEIKILKEIISKHKIIPVLAHIERYPVVFKNKELLSQLKEMGCIMQINTESLRGVFSKNKIIKLINEGYVALLGSDTHSTIRGCDYGMGFSVIEKKCKDEVIENICYVSQSLFWREVE
ncbi:MAG: CpsB/CapC family capsule biosynthesis tyrosine phosphatase [Acutalibacteraceae bacterium]|nr:CpsB/CapC family capsule biosynthesis tyrosine phosphatase [Acutalibacteraceae bacterium]